MAPHIENSKLMGAMLARHAPRDEVLTVANQRIIALADPSARPHHDFCSG